MKSKIIVLHFILVCGLGLVSCARDTRPQTSSGPLVSPRLESESERISIKDQFSTQSQVWALDDSLVFPQINDYQELKIQSLCRADGEELQEEKIYSMRSSYFLFQLIPQKLLAYGSSEIHCDVDFWASSSSHRHFFTLRNLKLSSVKKPNILIQDSSFSDMRESSKRYLDISNLLDSRIIFSEKKDGSVRLLCKDVEFESFGNASSFGDFDWRLTEEKTAALEKNNIQSCRIISVNNSASNSMNDGDKVESVSAPLEIRFPVAFLSVTSELVATKRTFVEDHRRLPLLTLSASEPQLFLSYAVTNQSSEKKTLRLPNSLGHDTSVIYPTREEIERILFFALRNTRLELRFTDPTVSPQKDASHTIVHLHPNQTVQIQYFFSRNRAEKGVRNGVEEGALLFKLHSEELPLEVFHNTSNSWTVEALLPVPKEVSISNRKIDLERFDIHKLYGF